MYASIYYVRVQNPLLIGLRQPSLPDRAALCHYYPLFLSCNRHSLISLRRTQVLNISFSSYYFKSLSETTDYALIILM